MITHIIWDYNGTVIDDVDMTVATVNEMLKSRMLPATTKEIYTATLKMPLSDYYAGIGITDKHISELSIEFHNTSLKYAYLSSVFSDFYETAKQAKSLGIKNILMSSLYNVYLNEEIDKYGIREYFTDIIGMDDTGLGSKLDNARTYIKKNKINTDNLIFIGDLTSDAMLAKEIGAKCILIPNGHNSKDRCEKEKVTVVENIRDIVNFF